jgi:hypothetical protein
MKILTPIRTSLLILAFFITGALYSEAQTLRGRVRDADNGQPITGATVNVYASKSGGTALSLATNPSGEFVFEKLRAGYYRCEVTAVGHESIYLTEISVSAGKEQVLDIDLRRSAAQLPEVTISASLPGRRPMQPMSEIPLTRDQTLRFPAMFFDPGRLAAAYPGVSQTDDGTNSMSIRGNSPASVRWRLEGLDIVNPNHLPNAGTQSDAPAAASGGVLMFSAQMLDNSSLLTGAFPAGYGDATSGVMDMNLRAGNKRQREFTAQVGLVGLDLAAEGPVKKGKDNSYLINYRYSTVGLLGQLGVSFGDEQINFQDLSFHLNFRGRKGGQYAIFGLGGLSENNFRHKEDSTEIKYDKDRFDIDFQSKTGVLGSSGKWRINAHNWAKAALVYSVQTNDWHKTTTIFEPPYDKDERTEERIAASLEWHLNVQQSQVSAGVQASRIYFFANILQVQEPTPWGSSYWVPYNGGFAYLNLQPWLRWDWASRNGRWNTQIGAQFHYNDVFQKLAPAPRGALTYRVAKKHKIALSAGLYKQDAPAWTQFFTAPYVPEANRVPYLSSFQAGIRYTWSPALFWKLSVEAFHQMTENIPAREYFETSLLNAPEFLLQYPLALNSQARNDGLELSLERNLQNGWFFAANGSVFKSQYQIEQGPWLDSRWDIGHLTNVTFGKEWQREKSATMTRTIGVGLRGIWSGGPREADIDLGLSAYNRRTTYDETRGYHRQNPDYFRIDLRVYWKRSLGDHRNSIFALDIQNLSGQQNLAYRFYDPLTKNIENKYQLGPIPNFSWRVEF